jgi:hypothetical protein
MRISLFKKWLTPSAQPWVNTYEFSDGTSQPPSSNAWRTVVDTLVTAEQAIHLPQVIIDTAVISTYRADGTPYNPSSFVTVAVGLNGVRSSAGTDILDLNAVYKMRRNVESGRNGKIAYRGCLVEFDVDANNSGRWVLVPNSSLSQSGTAFGQYQTIMAPLLNGGMDQEMALLSGPSDVTDPAFVRAVVSLLPYGVGFNKLDHRYFDRA